ncbi:hypothetical protein GQ600_6468 [Phytophthora cactorum]|nr:hypothetical protein GQ600_6468 [Phytophthora cactorum]
MVGSPASYISHRRRFGFISLSAMVYRTPQEKMLIVHTHKYFCRGSAKAGSPGTSCARACCQVFGGFGEHGCACVGCLQRTRRGSICGARGCPPRSEVENYREFITQVINDRNISRKPATSKIICSELKTLKGETIPCKRNLCEWKFPTSEVVNVAFRNAYLEKKLAILSARLVPKLTELYLDESYCNVNHVAGGAYVEQQPRSEIAPAPTMEELQDLAGEASDKVHCTNTELSNAVFLLKIYPLDASLLASKVAVSFHLASTIAIVAVGVGSVDADVRKLMKYAPCNFLATTK